MEIYQFTYNKELILIILFDQREENISLGTTAKRTEQFETCQDLSVQNSVNAKITYCRIFKQTSSKHATGQERKGNGGAGDFFNMLT